MFKLECVRYDKMMNTVRIPFDGRYVNLRRARTNTRHVVVYSGWRVQYQEAKKEQEEEEEVSLRVILLIIFYIKTKTTPATPTTSTEGGGC